MRNFLHAKIVTALLFVKHTLEERDEGLAKRKKYFSISVESDDAQFVDQDEANVAHE